MNDVKQLLTEFRLAGRPTPNLAERQLLYKEKFGEDADSKDTDSEETKTHDPKLEHDAAVEALIVASGAEDCTKIDFVAFRAAIVRAERAGVDEAILEEGRQVLVSMREAADLAKKMQIEA